MTILAIIALALFIIAYILPLIANAVIKRLAQSGGVDREAM